MGGDSGSNYQQPVQPTVQSSVQDWVNAMPQIYQTQMQYAPLQAQQQVELAQKYAQPYAQAMYDAQKSLYPTTVGLQEKLAGIADQGMSENAPNWMQQQYQSNMNAGLGSNAGAGIGNDYRSRGLMQMNEDWKRYYQNMGLSVAGRQPLTQASTPQTSDYMSSFTPASAMNMNSSTYGTSANLYNTNLANQGNSWTNQLLNIGGTLGGAALGGWSTNWGK